MHQNVCKTTVARTIVVHFVFFEGSFDEICMADRSFVAHLVLTAEGHDKVSSDGTCCWSLGQVHCATWNKANTNQFAIKAGGLFPLTGLLIVPTFRPYSTSVSCPFPSASIHASSWRKISKLIICLFLCCTSLRKRGLPRNFAHLFLSCPIRKRFFFKTLCIFDLHGLKKEVKWSEENIIFQQ